MQYEQRRNVDCQMSDDNILTLFTYLIVMTVNCKSAAKLKIAHGDKHELCR